MTERDSEKNKALVSRIFEELFMPAQPNLDLIEDIIHHDYVEHNPSIGQGREGLRDFLVNVYPALREAEEGQFVEMRLIADGDFVVSQLMRKDGMLVDIFRIEADRKSTRLNSSHTDISRM